MGMGREISWPLFLDSILIMVQGGRGTYADKLFINPPLNQQLLSAEKLLLNKSNPEATQDMFTLNISKR
jgi:hypothetical protein